MRKLNIDVLLFTVPVKYPTYPVQRFAEGRPIRCTTNLVTHSCVYTVRLCDSMYDLFVDYHKLRLLNMLTVCTNVAFNAKVLYETGSYEMRSMPYSCCSSNTLESSMFPLRWSVV